MDWLRAINDGLNLDRLVKSISNSLWQSNCPLCKRPTEKILCKDCDRQISAYQFPEFLQKDYPISPEIPLYSWGVYDGAVKRAVAACKYENHPQIMDAIAEKMAIRWQREKIASLKNISVIPIPLHPNKLKSRGFNQAEVLARRFCDLTSLPCNPKLLQRVKDTKPQMQTKSKGEREQNLSNAFVVSSVLRSPQKSHHHNVIIMDDIYTTGTTIREAIAALSAQNITVKSVIVLARPQFERRAPSLSR
jgi:ComF family protein